jgi:hypothetical protein
MEIWRVSRLMRSHTSGYEDDEPGAEADSAPAAGGAVAARSTPGFVRPVEDDDIEAIAALHARLMPNTRQLPPEQTRERFLRLLLQHPWRHQYLRSLVYEARGGRIAGCLGVMPRPMVFQGRPITAAIGHSFMVEPPGNRPLLAALAENFLAGPQDLSLAETGKVPRKLWESAGGEVSLIYSLCWTRPLKPTRYALSYLRRRGLPESLHIGLRPVCDLMDRLAPLAGRTFRRTASPAAIAAAGFGSALDGAGFCETAASSLASRSLYPKYEQPTADWLLQTLAQKSDRGDFHCVLVRNSQREIAGCYLYYVTPGGTASVVQLGARHDSTELVFDHLCRHARGQGAIAVSGQLDPAFFHTLAARDCVFHHDGGSWFLIHSRNPEILQAIHRGDAFLGRLESEWWISFLLS